MGETPLVQSINASSVSDELLAELAQKYTPILTRRFVKRGAQDATAQDLAQDVFVRLAKRAQGGEIENPEAYIMQTANSVWSDHWRKRQVRSYGAHIEYEDYLHSVEGVSPERVYEGKETISLVLEALKSLDKRRRQVFFLRRFEGLTQKEVAARLGISVSLVEKDMVRAIRHVTDWLGDA